MLAAFFGFLVALTWLGTAAVIYVAVKYDQTGDIGEVESDESREVS